MIDRSAIATRQADLIRALRKSEAPRDFDSDAVRRAGFALHSKRQRTLARAWPRLITGLAGDFPTLFRIYAEQEPLPPGGPIADGMLFAAWLAPRAQLSREALLEHAAARLRWRLERGGQLTPRTVAMALIKQPGQRWLLAVRFCKWEWWLRLL
jgi:hypothetical protein